MSSKSLTAIAMIGVAIFLIISIAQIGVVKVQSRTIVVPTDYPTIQQAMMRLKMRI